MFLYRQAAIGICQCRCPRLDEHVVLQRQRAVVLDGLVNAVVQIGQLGIVPASLEQPPPLRGPDRVKQGRHDRGRERQLEQGAVKVGAGRVDKGQARCDVARVVQPHRLRQTVRVVELVPLQCPCRRDDIRPSRQDHEVLAHAAHKALGQQEL